MSHKAKAWILLILSVITTLIVAGQNEWPKALLWPGISISVIASLISGFFCDWYNGRAVLIMLLLGIVTYSIVYWVFDITLQIVSAAITIQTLFSIIYIWTIPVNCAHKRPK